MMGFATDNHVCGARKVFARLHKYLIVLVGHHATPLSILEEAGSARALSLSFLVLQGRWSSDSKPWSHFRVPRTISASQRSQGCCLLIPKTLQRWSKMGPTYSPKD